MVPPGSSSVATTTLVSGPPRSLANDESVGPLGRCSIDSSSRSGSMRRTSEALARVAVNAPAAEQREIADRLLEAIASAGRVRSGTDARIDCDPKRAVELLNSDAATGRFVVERLLERQLSPGSDPSPDIALEEVVAARAVVAQFDAHRETIESWLDRVSGRGAAALLANALVRPSRTPPKPRVRVPVRGMIAVDSPSEDPIWASTVSIVRRWANHRDPRVRAAALTAAASSPILLTVSGGTRPIDPGLDAQARQLLVDTWERGSEPTVRAAILRIAGYADPRRTGAGHP